MKIFYNEPHTHAAWWLRYLGDAEAIPVGHVEEKSIVDVTAKELEDYDQCHFFAGIGGWPLALRWAGLEGLSGIWTGSPPCQPFSLAGKRLGRRDERHLAPVWLDLIRERKPGLIFGEQVEAAIRVGWLDDLFDALEECGYACGAAVLPACSVGAPHVRKRLFFGAVRLADANGARQRKRRGCESVSTQQPALEHSCQAYATPPHHGFWSGSDWLGCTDGKLRPVEPGTQPLDHGLPARVGRLRGYGNAIVPQVAQAFIASFMAAAQEAGLG